jgi:hypothetical protein
MKKILTLLLLSQLYVLTQAQVLFSQDFESGSVAPMTALDIDGKTLDQNVSNLSKTWDVFDITATDKKAISTSWFAPPGQCDDWLISPPIEITQANTFLIWEASSYGAAPYQESYQVLVSTTGSDLITKFTDVLFQIPAELNETQKRSVRLDAYIGQTINFAFRNNSYDKWLMFLDNIEVKILKNQDAIVKSVSFEKYNPLNSQVPITVTVENNGANPLTSFNFTWTDGVNTYEDSIIGANVETVHSAEFTHTTYYHVAETGEFDINVEVTQPNGVADEDSTNNFGGRTIYGLSEQLPKMVIVEEGTGTWCGWCPRGTVAMDDIAANHSDFAIPISIHNYDPMVFEPYDTPFSQTISGYPSGSVDRKEVAIDPNDPNTGYGFDDAVANLDERTVPVGVKVQTDYNEDTRALRIIATAHSSIATTHNSFRFSAIVTEDNVTGSGSLYAQVNYYAGGGNGPMGGYESLPNPVPANQMVYNYVARVLIGGYEGAVESIPDTLEADEDFTFDFNYLVPLGYNAENMKAIVFILDDQTGEILNSDVVAVTDLGTGVPLVPEGKSVLYPNPATDEMNLAVDFQTNDPVALTIYDTFGRLIKNLGNLDLSSGSKVEKINVSTLQTGGYILELRHKNSVTALPFTKI